MVFKDAATLCLSEAELVRRVEPWETQDLSTRSRQRMMGEPVKIRRFKTLSLRSLGFNRCQIDVFGLTKKNAAEREDQSE
ncbi:hypothetical protein Q5P01_025462 [Channa striata]|uniref:Uncharacterized protein n=1 Tax=Channa striata TaxID=64152 RepID=A0AA88IPL8_CHASR|nr:hypothetical protein Q5P01_025462 [Channa striata]